MRAEELVANSWVQGLVTPADDIGVHVIRGISDLHNKNVWRRANVKIQLIRVMKKATAHHEARVLKDGLRNLKAYRLWQAAKSKLSIVRNIRSNQD